MSHRTSPIEPYPVRGFGNQPSGTTHVGDPQTTRLGNSASGHTNTPRASSFFQEGRLSHASTTVDVIHRGSNPNAPNIGAPEVGSDFSLESPTRTWGRGDSLILAPLSRASDHGGPPRAERDPHSARLPPSRSNSASIGSQVDPNDRPPSEPRQGDQISPPTLSTESSVTPMIQFDRLEGVIPEDQIMELRHMVSNQSTVPQAGLGRILPANPA